ncbi:hypothetical protein [Desulfobacula toluolica]|uniref:Conserved uncharacterized protein n=1 Tax=Desulfobacula toluolica (strain DSM 7467 / Tol2) TaxID=651182 RepID=K0NJP6_DESTT|nr:hypothetical protein [Desulfobacula toluolica]CCK80098.1 conserved uncharacterized protein [Desulfobacula toluolica Tol2]
MERGQIENRLQALKGLNDDIFSTADGPMAKNTARVLLQIMKELVRAKGDYPLQLRLAHDFRMAAFGKPRIVRRLLKHYHLLEMPEEWNQITFDDHVHDANTSGRKSPTHLIMDAWIKGIRRLRVIYYHYIEPRFAAELIEAARIMEIDLRIGIEFWAAYRNSTISLIWVSRGLPDVDTFLCFLAEPHVVEFMEQGKAVLKFQEKCVLRLLSDFNEQKFDTLCRDFDIDMKRPVPEEFLRFAFPGQPSVLHLGEYIHSLAIFAMKERIKDLNQMFSMADAEEQQKIKQMVEKMDCFSAQDIISNYLRLSQHHGMPMLFDICNDIDLPDRLKINFKELLVNIEKLHHGFRITLNLGDLKPEDVLEILYESNGLVTRLEIVNLKDFILGKTDHIFSVNALQEAINDGSLLKLKRVVRQIITSVEQSDYVDKTDRLKKLVDVLHDIDALKNMYSVRPLKSRLGSDSNGRSNQTYGMGFGIVNTLTFRAKKEIQKYTRDRLILPANIKVNQRVTSFPINSMHPVLKWVMNILKRLPGLDQIMQVQKKEWVFEAFSMDMKQKGNIVTLGGIQKDIRNGLRLDLPDSEKNITEKSWNNLNTRLKNGFKVIIGFIPAFICFALTKDWWFLAYFGAFIWFGITGIRNVLQSVLGGGGLRRSSLLKWNDYISWERLTDSLLYTGFSVPLLDYVIKTVLLDKTFGINITSSPMVLYSCMALANGIYLSTHNAFRGFPKGVITGNFFRSILSIPVAVVFSSMVGGMLSFFGVAAVEAVLQKWATIISKAASDTVAGIIEGTADRFHNMGLRKRDIKKKFSDLFDTYSKLEFLFPEVEELKILEKSEELFNSRNSEVKDLARMIIINSLDLFYFWMYLPRARTVMIDMVSRLTPEEKIIFLQSQKILEHEQYISRLFVDGILGRNFSRPLSFYLTTYKNYLYSIEKIN